MTKTRIVLSVIMLLVLIVVAANVAILEDGSGRVAGVSYCVPFRSCDDSAELLERVEGADLVVGQGSLMLCRVWLGVSVCLAQSAGVVLPFTDIPR